MNRKKDAPTALVYGVLIFIALICLFSIVWIHLISIKSTSENITGSNSLVVSDLTMANLKRLFEMIPVGQDAFSSVLTTIMGTVTPLLFCAPADFAFIKYRLPGRKFPFCFVITTTSMPPEVGSVPLFIIMKEVGLIDSLWSLITPRIATAVDILYMNQHITDVPDELVEMAKIDGHSNFDIFTRIILPVTKPAMAPWGAITPITRWNDFFWPLLYLRKRAKHMSMVTISLLPVNEGLSTPQPVILAGTTPVIIPVVILYLILEKFQKAGMMEGAVKG